MKLTIEEQWRSDQTRIVLLGPHSTLRDKKVFDKAYAQGLIDARSGLNSKELLKKKNDYGPDIDGDAAVILSADSRKP